MQNLVEILEQRRLLSLTPTGPVSDVAGAGASPFDLAVAGNGNFIIARVTGLFTATTHNVELLRYSGSGQQIGDIVTVGSGANVSSVAVSMDSTGDAVVAYTNNGVYVARISSAGVVSTPTLIDSIGRDPDVSMDSSGGYFLAYIGSEMNDVRVEAFDSGGVSKAPMFGTFGVSNTNGIGPVHIATRPDGTGAVVTAFETFEGADDNVAFARVSTTAMLGTAT